MKGSLSSALRRLLSPLALTVMLGTLVAPNAQAIITYESPTLLLGTPPGSYEDRGWNYLGYANKGQPYLGQIAWPIAPNYFVTAKHIASTFSVATSPQYPNGFSDFMYNGDTFNVTNRYDIPGGDLTLFKIDGTFDNWIPLYTGGDETGKELFTIGQGFLRKGSEIHANGTNRLNGHRVVDNNGSNTTKIPSWGRNMVSEVGTDNTYGDLIRFTYDQPGTGDYIMNESIVSAGDSGGGVFIEEDGTWKLAGVILGVDGNWRLTPGGTTTTYGAIFDARDLYVYDGTSYPLITGDDPVPFGSYATRISNRIGQIESITGPIPFGAIVPEPGTIALMSIGLLGFVPFARRRRK